MALIKSINTHRLLKDAIVLEIGDVNRQAERIIAIARTEAERIVAAGKAEAQRLTESADTRGHAEGFARGQAEGHDAGQREGHAQAITRSTERVQVLVQNWTAALSEW